MLSQSFFPRTIAASIRHFAISRGGEAEGGDKPFITGISEALLKVRF
jgi:hypothetical protein